MSSTIDVVALEELMRARCLDVEKRRVLLSRLSGTSQEADLTDPPNCGGFGRIRHFRVSTAPGWPPNPLPGLPFARCLGRPLSAVTNAQLFQIGGCAMRCWYCFVPFRLLAGDERQGAWFTADEIVRRYLDTENRPALIVLSGGSPDVAPEWTAWMMDSLEAYGLSTSTYLWIDDNLSSDRLVAPLNAPILRRMERYRNHGRVCCLKGYDGQSFAFTTGGHPESFERQLSILERYVETDIDLYGYVTFGAPDRDAGPAIDRLLDRLCVMDTCFVSRIIPLRIVQFGPTSDRMDEARTQALFDQDRAVEIWMDGLARRGIAPLWGETE